MSEMWGGILRKVAEEKIASSIRRRRLSREGMHTVEQTLALDVSLRAVVLIDGFNPTVLNR
ncbi:hypothetical protein [Paraburkholderia sp. RL18-085-BIA-A]|uniref:hypothetical protein n=1 Tax=Paraburkholderia sp. RL18-085-BIA-A TaxID=3031633 RepID=UPI0038B73740